MPSKHNLLIPRIFVGIVTFFNLQCALVFLLYPERYAPAFEVSGIPGSSLVSALGILFLMWNVPYVFALYHPLKHRVSLVQAVIMQTIGLLGEFILYLNTPTTHTILRQTALRFIIFDGAGLLFLIAAVYTANKFSRVRPEIG